MKKLLQPKVLIPLILGVAFVVALLAFADIKTIVALIVGFQKIYLLWFLLLMVAYEVVRGVQWHVLLRALDIHVPLRTQIFAFAGGEITKSMPVGNYFQNYLLQQSKDADFGRTAAATTLIIVLEVVVSLAGVVILGLGQWTAWLRPAIILGMATCLLAAWAYHRFHQHARTPRWIREHKTLRKAMDELKELRAGAADLVHPRVLLIATLLSAGYLLTAGAGLFVVVRGLGIGGVAFPEALAVSFFSLAVSLIIPIPVDVGIMELSGVSAFLAIGIQGGTNAAVGAMLLNRLLSIIASLAIAGVVMLTFRGEFHAALRDRSERNQDQAAAAPRDVAS